jgi:Na+/H+ antiporter NhaC
VLSLVPAGWLWLFDISFWFNYLIPYTPQINPFMHRLGLADGSQPRSYLIFALALTFISLLYVVLALTLWNGKKKEKKDSLKNGGCAGIELPRDN